jgi:hypothetical protein
MASDDFLQRDVPEYGDDREYPQPRDADEDLADREAEGEKRVIAEERIGLTPPD